MRGRPWNVVGSIRYGGNVFNSMSSDWCPTCRSIEDCDTDAEYEAGTYVYRRRCNRCGSVIKHGAYNVPLICGDRPLDAKTIIWCHTPGEDRR